MLPRNVTPVLSPWRLLLFGLPGCALILLATAETARGGPLGSGKAEDACGYSLTAVHGPCGAAADLHVVAGLPAAFWTHAPFICNYVPGPPNGVGVGINAQHIVPDCHPLVDAAMGGLWAPSWSIAAPPVGGGPVASASGARRTHVPHEDVFAGTLTVTYTPAGAVAGYEFVSTGKHDPENCMAACTSTTGNQAVPPTASVATGAMALVVDGLTLDFGVSIAVRNISPFDVIGAAICLGGPGQVGPPIFDLGGAGQWEDLQGVGIGRMIPSASFPPEYLHALQQGQTYVNIQTRMFPQGEIRGQLTIPPMQQMADMNCDGMVNSKDIRALLQAMKDPSGYSAQYPGCDLHNGDMDGDGILGEQDAQWFAAALLAR